MGKTSLIRRTVENLFTEDYKITIGVDFFIKKIQRQDKYIDLQVGNIVFFFFLLIIYYYHYYYYFICWFS